MMCTLFSKAYLALLIHFITNNHTSNNMKQPMNSNASSSLLFFCGNFGILLINSSWVNIDGGKAALDMLEKMVEVTMMRGKLIPIVILQLLSIYRYCNIYAILNVHLTLDLHYHTTLYNT